MYGISRRALLPGLLMSIAGCARHARIDALSDDKPVYYIGTYDIDDPERFKGYPPRVRPLLEKYGGRLLAMDMTPYVLEGHPRKMSAIICFPSKAAAVGLYNDPDYQEAKRIRQQSTSSCTMILVEALAG